MPTTESRLDKLEFQVENFSKDRQDLRDLATAFNTLKISHVETTMILKSIQEKINQTIVERNEQCREHLERTQALEQELDAVKTTQNRAIGIVSGIALVAPGFWWLVQKVFL